MTKIDGVRIVLRNAWDRDMMARLDEYLPQQSVECMVTIHGLETAEATNDWK